jgi:hypothetical protein
VDEHDVEWPAEGVRLLDAEGKASAIRLTPADGEAIRCALLAHFATPESHSRVASNFVNEPGTWRVAAPSFADSRTRVGSYYVHSGNSDDEVVLTRTLEVRPMGRYSLEARLRRHGRSWTVESFGGVIAHARH